MRSLSILGLALCGASLLPVNLARGQSVALMIAAGHNHSLAVMGPASPFSPVTDKTIMAWGDNYYGECNVPAPNSGFVAVSGGSFHSLGLKSNGTVVAWGDNSYSQCTVPLPNSGFVAVAGGGAHSIGLKSGGTIVAWGHNTYGQCAVPAPNANFVAIAGGSLHSLGLKSDGTIVAWGYNFSGQCNVPAPNSDFVAVAAGSDHSLGLKSDGTIVAWGYNAQGQCDVPAPNESFVAVASGHTHSMGLKSDGTIVAWGYNADGECNVPAPNAGFEAIAGGDRHSLGLKSDGSILAWGINYSGQCNVPPYPTGSPTCPTNTVNMTPGSGFASYNPSTGNLDAYVDTYCTGLARIDVTDDFVIRNLPTGTPVTFTGHMDWVVDEGGGLCLAVITSLSPTFPAQVLAGQTFRLQFSAGVETPECGGDFCDFIHLWGSAQGHLWFSDLPAGAVVTSCQGYLQGDITSVKETPVAPAPLAIRRLSPNPSSGPFDASITLASDSPSALDVFDVRGRLVTRATTKGLGRGEHRIGIRASSDLPSGIYFVRLTQGARTVWAKEAIVH